MILRILEGPDGRFRLVRYSKAAAHCWSIITSTRAEAEAAADKLASEEPTPGHVPPIRAHALHAREPRYLVSSVSRYARHYVAEGSLPPHKALCGRVLDAVSLSREEEAEVTCPPCRVARRERIEWTARP